MRRMMLPPIRGTQRGCHASVDITESVMQFGDIKFGGLRRRHSPRLATTLRGFKILLNLIIPFYRIKDAYRRLCRNNTLEISRHLVGIFPKP